MVSSTDSSACGAAFCCPRSVCEGVDQLTLVHSFPFVNFYRSSHLLDYSYTLGNIEPRHMIDTPSDIPCCLVGIPGSRRAKPLDVGECDWLQRRTTLLVGGDLVLVRQRDADVVEALEQPPARVVVDVEGVRRASDPRRPTVRSRRSTVTGGRRVGLERGPKPLDDLLVDLTPRAVRPCRSCRGRCRRTADEMTTLKP